MFEIDCKITIADNTGREKMQITEIGEVQIVSGFRQLTETATFVLPRRVKIADKIQLLDDAGVFREGDKVEIEAGYNNQVESLFRGYIRRIGVSFPLQIECENEAYRLKKMTVKPKEFKAAKLNEVLAYVIPADISVKASEMNLGRFLIAQTVTVAKVLENICSQYSAFAFFRGETLYVGVPFWSDYQKTIPFIYGENIVNADGLRYLKAGDVKIKIKAVSLTADNKKLEVEVGDHDGALRTFHYNDIQDKADLKSTAKRILAELKYDGLKGTLEVFGVPVVRQGDAVDLDFSRAEYMEGLQENDRRNGKYLVERVVTKIGFSSGYRQIIDLGKKL